MGGRGASGGTGGGGGGAVLVQRLVKQYKEGVPPQPYNPNGNAFHSGEGNPTGDYTNNNDPQLLKWQGQQDEAKAARYLATLGKAQTPAQDAQGYAYHQSPFQNMVISMNLNAPVYAELSAKDFNAYVQQTGLTPIYRGWSSAASKDRFTKAAMSHTGAGMYGEGFYFGDQYTAQNYARSSSLITTAALSPAARVVDYNEVRRVYNSLTPTMRRALTRSGQTNSNFANNDGESQLALKMGYNVIRTDWSYVALTRDALVVRK